MRYNKPLSRKHRNQAERRIYESCSVDQFIDKVCEPQTRIMSQGKQAVLNIARRTGKPYCSPYGLINPVKLDISNLKKDK